MLLFEAYLLNIADVQQRARMEEILSWVSEKFPVLEAKIAWNQPMYIDHGTFIIGFSISKQHISISPEMHGIDHFTADIHEAGYSQSANLFRIKWSDPINFSLLEKVIEFNIKTKADCLTFWR